MAKSRDATQFTILYFDPFWRPNARPCKDMDEVREAYAELTVSGDNCISPKHIHLYSHEGNVKEILGL